MKIKTLGDCVTIAMHVTPGQPNVYVEERRFHSAGGRWHLYKLIDSRNGQIIREGTKAQLVSWAERIWGARKFWGFPTT